MGGTSCKVAGFDLKNQIIQKTIIKTSSTDAQVTLDEISQWISSKF
jgi:predicted NBD/HSP70 family sugar kinase